MRDGQIIHLIKSELAHWENISILRNKQTEMRINSMTEVLGKISTFFKAIFIKDYINKEIDRVYTGMAKEYNNKIKSALSIKRV